MAALFPDVIQCMMIPTLEIKKMCVCLSIPGVGPLELWRTAEGSCVGGALSCLSEDNADPWPTGASSSSSTTAA